MPWLGNVPWVFVRVKWVWLECDPKRDDVAGFELSDPHRLGSAGPKYLGNVFG